MGLFSSGNAKRDGSLRWCVDYWELNKLTKKVVFPLPLIEEIIDTLAGNMWFQYLMTHEAIGRVR